MAGLSAMDLEALPRVRAAGVNDDVIIRQGSQLCKIRVADLISGLAGAAGASDSFEAAGGETVTVVNGIVTGVTGP